MASLWQHRLGVLAVATALVSTGCNGTTPVELDKAGEDGDPLEADGGSGAACADSACVDTTSCGDLDAEEQALVVLVNDHRKQAGLWPLAGCRSLHRAAQMHSEDMRDHAYFSHTALDGSLPDARACQACYALGCGPQTAIGENIAAGYPDAVRTFTQWKNSPGHDANMLSRDYSVFGVGRALGDPTYAAHWTNVFGGDVEASCD